MHKATHKADNPFTHHEVAEAAGDVRSGFSLSGHVRDELVTYRVWAPMQEEILLSNNGVMTALAQATFKCPRKEHRHQWCKVRQQSSAPLYIEVNFDAFVEEPLGDDLRTVSLSGLHRRPKRCKLGGALQACLLVLSI